MTYQPIVELLTGIDGMERGSDGDTGANEDLFRLLESGSYVHLVQSQEPESKHKPVNYGQRSCGGIVNL